MSLMRRIAFFFVLVPSVAFAVARAGSAGEQAARKTSIDMLSRDAPQEAASEAQVQTKASSCVVETLCASLDVGTGGLEVDAEGFVYTSDFGSKLGRGGIGGTKVLRIDPKNGEAELFFDGQRGASGNAFGPDGSFYQSNIGANLVTRRLPDGTSSVFVREHVANPVGVVVDRHGMVYVANCGSSSILAVTPDGASSVLVQDERLSCPNGITLDEEGNLYVANFNNGDVLRITPLGEASVLATLPGNNNGHLVYREGSLYVVARGDHRIYRVSLGGQVHHLAGSGKRGHADGTALEASFSYPNDLAFSPDGTILYVNECAPTTGPHTELRPTVVRRIRLGAPAAK